MEPRLKSSTQWSPFPEELCTQAAQVLNERFQDEYDLEDAQFVVEGRIFREEIVGRFGLRFKDQLKQYNFEISFEFDPEKDKALDLIQVAMDVVEHLWTELLEEDLNDSELLKTWQTLPLNKKMYHYRYSTMNSALEEEADRWLEEHEKKLVYTAENHDPYAGLSQDTEPTVH